MYKCTPTHTIVIAPVLTVSELSACEGRYWGGGGGGAAKRLDLPANINGDFPSNSHA